MFKRGYTNDDMKEMDFHPGEYSRPTQDGELIGTLVMKEWTKFQSIQCFFDGDDGRKMKINGWFKGKKELDYKPKISDVDMSYAELRTKWHITFIMNKNGNPNWLTATEI
jgi:hypothetical protein